MKTRTKSMIAIVLLLPLTLMAKGVLTEHDSSDTDGEKEREPFRMVDLVPRQSAGFANSFYTVPPLPY